MSDSYSIHLHDGVIWLKPSWNVPVGINAQGEYKALVREALLGMVSALDNFTDVDICILTDGRLDLGVTE